MTSSSEPDSVAINRELWTRTNAEYTDAKALEAWQRPDLLWGVWNVPESDVRALPDDVAGLDVVELGCGTAYVCAWFARNGARAVGVDPTPAQLQTARRCQAELGIEFPLVEAPGESVPLADASPTSSSRSTARRSGPTPHRWIPEAARLLRPGGGLVVSAEQHALDALQPGRRPGRGAAAAPAGFGLHRIDWEDDEGGVEFHLGHGDWIRLLRANGFEIEST